MASYNRVVLVGNLTRDPELRYTPSSMAVTDIGLAVNDKRKNANGEWVEETTFIDVTLWGTAEVASEYLKKGASVLIEGRLKLDQWDDKESGQKRSKLKVVGEKMQMLGGKGGGGGGGGGGRGASHDEDYGAPSENYGSASAGASRSGGSAPSDDIPF